MAMQSGLYDDYSFAPLMPVIGEIIDVFITNGNTDGVTPHMTRVRVMTMHGNLSDVPLLRSTPTEVIKPRKGDYVVVGFINGAVAGAFVMGFLDKPSAALSRDIPDAYYKIDEFGNCTRTDETGCEVTQRTKSIVDVGVE